MNFTPRKRSYKPRRGFSLAEILVAVALIAILSAVMLPGLNSHLRKSDAARLAGDLTSIQTGAQEFVADVHRFPSAITQLTTPITTSAADVDGSTIPPYLVAKWKGPYLAKTNIANTSVGSISPTLISVNDASTNVNYLTVVITSPSYTEFQELEALLDPGTAPASSATLGVVRWSSTTSTILFLALPIL